jgi:predicted ribosomally synthesized peptide with nif11-like leader
MLSESIQAFNHKVATSPTLQEKLRAVTSPLDFLSLAQSEGVDLTHQDFQIIAQQAFEHWLAQLEPKIRGFFRHVQDVKELNNQLKACQSTTDAIALAQQWGVQLSEDDLQQAARIAESIPGFSFEKLWFKGLGLIQ